MTLPAHTRVHDALDQPCEDSEGREEKSYGFQWAKIVLKTRGSENQTRDVFSSTKQPKMSDWFFLFAPLGVPSLPVCLAFLVVLNLLDWTFV